MKFECNHGSKKFGSEQGLAQHSSAVHSRNEVKEGGKVNLKKYLLQFIEQVICFLLFNKV